MNSKQLTIAIAEDHVTTRSIISGFLSKCGYIVIFEVDNGSVLLERIEATDMIPDVCIVDINMPEMDGFETTKQLKQRWPSTKVLVISGEDYSGQVSKILHLGGDGFLPKHCTIEELIEAITNLYKK